MFDIVASLGVFDPLAVPIKMLD